MPGYRSPNAVLEFFPTDADLSSSKYLIVKQTTDGTDLDLADDGDEAYAGILTNEVDDFSGLPSGSYGSVGVVTRGQTQCIAGTASGITAGVLVMADAAGKAVLCTDAKWAVGIAKSNPAANGDLFVVDVNPQYYTVA